MKPCKAQTIRNLVSLFCLAVIMAAGGSRALAAPGNTPVRDVDGGIVNPWAAELAFFEGTGGSYPTTGTNLVAAGVRVEITQISGQFYGAANTNLTATIQVTCGGTTVKHRIAGIIRQPNQNGYFILPLTSMSLYADPSTPIVLSILYDTPPALNTGYNVDFVMTGRQVRL